VHTPPGKQLEGHRQRSRSWACCHKVYSHTRYETGNRPRQNTMLSTWVLRAKYMA